MKKKILLFALLLLLFTCVRAESACDKDVKKEISSYANNVKVEYKTNEYTSQIEQYNSVTKENELVDYVYHSFDIKIYNIVPDLYVTVKDETNKETINLTSSNVGSDGTITINVPASTLQNQNYTIEVYSYITSCFSSKIRSIKVTLPMYNIYSERNECDDIPEFYMCKEYTTSSISAAKFKSEIASYKKSITENEVTFIDETKIKTSSTISDYHYFFILFIIVVGLFISVIIYRQYKKGVK